MQQALNADDIFWTNKLWRDWGWTVFKAVKDNLLDCEIDNGWILFLNEEILGKPLKKGYQQSE